MATQQSNNHDSRWSRALTKHCTGGTAVNVVNTSDYSDDAHDRYNPGPSPYRRYYYSGGCNQKRKDDRYQAFGSKSYLLEAQVLSFGMNACAGP